MALYELISLLLPFWEVSGWEWGPGGLKAASSTIVSSPLGKLEKVKSLQSWSVLRQMPSEASESGQAAGVQGP